MLTLLRERHLPRWTTVTLAFSSSSLTVCFVRAISLYPLFLFESSNFFSNSYFFFLSIAELLSNKTAMIITAANPTAFPKRQQMGNCWYGLSQSNGITNAPNQLQNKINVNAILWILFLQNSYNYGHYQTNSVSTNISVAKIVYWKSISRIEGKMQRVIKRDQSNLSKQNNWLQDVMGTISKKNTITYPTVVPIHKYAKKTEN